MDISKAHELIEDAKIKYEAMIIRKHLEGRRDQRESFEKTLSGIYQEISDSGVSPDELDTEVAKRFVDMVGDPAEHFPRARAIVEMMVRKAERSHVEKMEMEGSDSAPLADDVHRAISTNSVFYGMGSVARQLDDIVGREAEVISNGKATDMPEAREVSKKDVSVSLSKAFSGAMLRVASVMKNVGELRGAVSREAVALKREAQKAIEVMKDQMQSSKKTVVALALVGLSASTPMAGASMEGVEASPTAPVAEASAEMSVAADSLGFNEAFTSKILSRHEVADTMLAYKEVHDYIREKPEMRQAMFEGVLDEYMGEYIRDIAHSRSAMMDVFSMENVRNAITQSPAIMEKLITLSFDVAPEEIREQHYSAMRSLLQSDGDFMIELGTEKGFGIFEYVMTREVLGEMSHSDRFFDMAMNDNLLNRSFIRTEPFYNAVTTDPVLQDIVMDVTGVHLDRNDNTTVTIDIDPEILPFSAPNGLTPDDAEKIKLSDMLELFEDAGIIEEAYTDVGNIYYGKDTEVDGRSVYYSIEGETGRTGEFQQIMGEVEKHASPEARDTLKSLVESVGIEWEPEYDPTADKSFLADRDARLDDAPSP